MLWALIVVFAVAIDQAVKYWSIHWLKAIGDIALIKDVFHLSYTTNEGASWGILSGQRVLFIITTLICIAIIIYVLYVKKPVSKKLCWSLTLILGGALGNFIDRVIYGKVVDMFYIKLINFPVFNVADMFLTAGAILLCWYILFDYDKKAVKNDTEQDN